MADIPTTHPTNPRDRLWRKWRRRLLFSLPIPPLLFLLSILCFRAAVAWLPYPSQTDQPIISSTWIEDSDQNPLAAFASTTGQWCLPIQGSDMSQHLIDAIVATEDSRFYQHHGVDWQSATAAAWHDLIKLNTSRGASTITMQLFRLREPASRSFSAKLLQAIRATQIEQTMSKRDILVEYLNRAPFGGNIVGAQAASWRYFNRPCKDLSLGQAALLAGIPQNPNAFRPDRFPDRAKARRDHVLDRMLACGFITPSQQTEAAAEPIDATWYPLPQDSDPSFSPSPGAPGEGQSGGFAQYQPGFQSAFHPTIPTTIHPTNPTTIGLLPTLANLATQYPGQILHTTINANSQRQATVAAQKTLEHLTASHITAVAVVILDTPTGNCLAAVSLTSDIQKSAAQIDLTTRPRSTGSTLKPFIYAAAFDAGICTPQSIINDTPTAWAGYEPSDYDRDFRGPLTAAGALAQSRNIPALLLLSKVGIPRAIQIMSAMGLKTLAKTPDQYGLPLAIGGADATPLELAEAYATLARNGQHLPAHLLKKTEMGTQLISGRASDLREMGTQLISDPQHSNEEVFSRNLVSGPSVSASRNPSSPIGKLIRADSLRPEICRQTLYCLADPDRTAAVWPAAVACGPAWKTGTSSGHRDAWCAAVTPSRTVVVWLGNADGAGSDTLVGQDVAAPLALQIIAAECASAETLERETRPAPAPPTPEPRMPSPNRTAGEISLDAANASMPLPAAQIIDIPTPGFTPPPGFNKSPPTGAPELAAYSDGLTILSPTPGQEILHDPTIPDASQRLALKARLSGSEADTTNEITLAIKIYWFIDGVSVGATNANETLLWTPTPGPHQIRATSESGRSAHVEFRVR